MHGTPGRLPGVRVGATWSGLAIGTALGGSAALAHLAAGGGSPSSVVLPASLVAVCLTCVTATGFRWSPGRLLSASIASQFALHLLMQPGTADASSPGSALHGAHAHGADWSMPLAHAAAVVAITVLVRYGGRCLRAMPAMFRILLTRVGPVSPAPIDRPGRVVGAGTAAAGNDVSVAWTMVRGPPRG